MTEPNPWVFITLGLSLMALGLGLILDGPAVGSAFMFPGGLILGWGLGRAHRQRDQRHERRSR